jgi:hypothetical protein
MLTRPQVQRYAIESGLRDIMIAEKEIVLTYLLQLLSERGILGRLAFKGGTCLRKMFFGSQGRFSTDLDFTGLEEHDHEDIILEMMGAFEQPFDSIHFSIPDDGYYETQDQRRARNGVLTSSANHSPRTSTATIVMVIELKGHPTLAESSQAACRGREGQVVLGAWPWVIACLATLPTPASPELARLETVRPDGRTD